MERFYRVAESLWFWLAGIAFLLVMEGIALAYQYIGDMYPCALCVQIRAWVAGAIIIAIVAALCRKHFYLRYLGLTLTLLFLSGALYTSWYSWQVELGNIVSSCAMGAGFPDFMPLDSWVPWLFAAEGFCGQSPDMPLGFSMNEVLLLTLSPPVVILSLLWALHARCLLKGEH